MADNPLGDLTKEAGSKGPNGFPVWGYAVILAVLYLGYEWFKGRSGSTSSTSSSTAGTSPADSSGVTGDGGVTYYYDSPVYSAEQGSPYSAAPPSPATNGQWERAVEDWLISKGETPGDVSDTLDDYLGGQPLDRSERRLIDLGEQFWGSPPGGVPLAPSASSASSGDTGDTDGGGEDTGDADGGSSDTDGNGGSPGGGPKRPGRRPPGPVHRGANPPAAPPPVVRPPGGGTPPTRRTEPPRRRAPARRR